MNGAGQHPFGLRGEPAEQVARGDGDLSGAGGAAEQSLQEGRLLLKPHRFGRLRVELGAPRRFGDGVVQRAEAVDQAELPGRSEEHTSELQSLMRNSYAVFCLKTKK